MRISFLKVVGLVLLSTNFVFCQKKLVFQDAAYEENIKTVLLYPAGGATRSNLQPAAALRSQQNLLLEFDDIQESKNSYYARLIHCTYNWSKSSLNDLDFMSVYNEFNINDYQFSNNTFLPYIHYRFQVPPVKISGNYLLIVYRDGDRSDVVLSMRMMIYDEQVQFAVNNDLAGQSALVSSNQQINFLVNYGDLQVFNPMDNFRVVIRQNQRWDNAKFDVKPSFIRDDLSQMEFRFFDQDKQWAAGNEFRFVDFRSLISPGQNTASLNRKAKPFELTVRTDQSREGLAYAQYRDLDGNFAIENLDYGDPSLSSQYIFVNFTLKATRLPDATVYVLGNYNRWARTDENKMVYNPSTSSYQASIVLKQGWYDYQYGVDSKTLPSYYFEGSHFQTQNNYEVFVYYKSLQPQADLLLGYFWIPVNPR